ncbi:MAG: putative manganese-dependent inorganic diphosphatase [Lachnospiraceae bacterium]
MSTPKRVYVIGHKNPDTDSICSAIAYADIKNRTTHGQEFVPKRAGQVNAETEFVLNRFGVEAPGFVLDVGGQVRDMDLHEIPYVQAGISIKDAWELMTENDAVTLPITDSEHRLEGIVTIGDIAKYFMDPTDKFPLSSAKTQYKSMADTLGGKVIVGNELGLFNKGKVIVGAGNPDLIKEFMEGDDLVIVGDREDAQIAALEAFASCLVISCDSQVEQRVIDLAKSNSAVIITTPVDTYTIARLINQSIPVRFLMRREKLTTFNTRASIEEVQDIMAKKRYRDFPVLDSMGRCKGTVSRRNLISVKKKQVILVDHNEKGQAVDNINEADVLEIIDHHKLGAIETLSPIFFRNQPVGCTATIIFQMYQERNLEIPKYIAGLLCAAILSDTLMFRSPTCTKYDQDAANQLSQLAEIEIESFANEMFKAGSNMGDKSAEEIFYQDFKKFNSGDISFGVGQINAMNTEILGEIEEKIYPLLEREAGKNGLNMIFFMLTNIISESTQLICFGEGSERFIEDAFHAKVKGHKAYLPNIVSRKKQFIPSMVRAIQEL